MKRVKHILKTVSLVIYGVILSLALFFNNGKQDIARLNYTMKTAVSSQYSFFNSNSPLGEACLTNIAGGNGSACSMRLPSVNLINAGLLEKILFYSSHREKFLSNISIRPFPRYILNYLGTAGCYYIYALREIII